MNRSQPRSRWDPRRSLFRPTPVGGSRERATALGALYLAGAVLTASALLLAGGHAVGSGVVLVVGVAAGVLLLRFGDRLPRWGFHPVLAAGSALVALLAWSTGPGPTPVAYATLLVWVALYAGYFFSLAGAAGHGVLALTCYALALGQLAQPLETELFLLTGVAAVVAGVANWLSHGRALSEVDPLTGVANRRGLARHLDAHMTRAAATRATLSLGLIDVDDFRRVNQQLGTGVADELLVTLTRRFRAALPPGATLARYGGDEFVVLLPGYGLTRAREIVDGIRSATPEGYSCSAGVAAWAPGDSQFLLVSRADMALYTAKRGGRGRTIAMGEDPDAASELWTALDAGEIEVHYQPIHDLASGELAMVEALVRWRHPTRGLLEPQRFVPAAEYSGAIHALGRWVARVACEDVARIRQRLSGAEAVGVAINLSTAQLSHPDLVTELRAAIDASGLPPHALTVELTEGAFEGDLDRVTSLLHQLKALGIRLAMDDYGTGHSSLARLRSLPFDVLKIDRSFVRSTGSDGGAGSGRDGNGAAADGEGPLLPAIVGVARSLGLETVAEGVEEVHQLQFVTEHGCTRAQGFLLGRPVCAADLETRLADGWQVPHAWGVSTG